MFQLKRMLRKDEVRVFLFAAILASVMLLIDHGSGLLRNLSDWIFMLGLGHILVGSVRYIKNVGLFKTFAYSAYKWRWKRHGKAAGEARPMSLAEYTQNVIMDETRQRPVGWALCAGILCCAASFLLATAVSRP